MTPLTIDDKTAKLSRIASEHTLETLSELTLKELRALAKGLLSGVRTAKKAELVADLLKLSEPYMVYQSVQEIEPLQVSEDRAFTDDLATEVWGSILALTNKSMPQGFTASEYSTLAGLGSRVVTILTTHRGNDGYSTPLTVLKNRTLFFKALTLHRSGSSFLANPEAVDAAIAFIRNHTTVALNPLQEQKGNDYRASVAARTRDTVSIHWAPLEKWVVDTLTDLGDHTPKYAYTNVSIALALATGRRQSEIHHSAVFEALGDHELAFTGQLKAKGRAADHYAENPTYTIPSLVETSLVIKAMKWLEANGRRVNTPTLVNSRFAKPLSEGVKTFYTRFELPPLKYHSLRAIYAQVCAKTIKPTQMKDIAYIAQIMGHSIDDIQTAQAYNADFEVIV